MAGGLSIDWRSVGTKFALSLSIPQLCKYHTSVNIRQTMICNQYVNQRNFTFVKSQLLDFWRLMSDCQAAFASLLNQKQWLCEWVPKESARLFCLNIRLKTCKCNVLQGRPLGLYINICYTVWFSCAEVFYLYDMHVWNINIIKLVFFCDFLFASTICYASIGFATLSLCNKIMF